MVVGAKAICEGRLAPLVYKTLYIVDPQSELEIVDRYCGKVIVVVGFVT